MAKNQQAAVPVPACTKHHSGRAARLARVLDTSRQEFSDLNSTHFRSEGEQGLQRESSGQGWAARVHIFLNVDRSEGKKQALSDLGFHRITFRPPYTQNFALPTPYM